jgi:type IV secretion system protein VirD4
MPSPDSVLLGLQYDAKGQTDLIAAEMLRGTRREHGNIAVVGAPGSGKGLMIKANLLNWQHSVVVVDLKGDTYADTANFRESELKQKIYVLDPKSATGHRFDPVAAIPKANRRQLAFEIVSRGDDVASGGRFWVNSALAWWLAVWAAADLEGQPHMPFAVQLCEMGLAASVLYLLERHGGVAGGGVDGAASAAAGQTEKAEHDEVIKPLIAFLGNHPKLMTVESLLEPSKLLESKWATVVESVTPFAHPAIMRVFSGNDLDLEGLFYEPASIYVMADETNEETFSAFLQLTMKALGDALIRIGDRTSFENRRPILFLFDEFGRVQLPSALSWLDTMRSRGIVLVLFLQKFSQIQGKPGSSSGGGRWEDDENSVHHWVIYKPTTTANRASMFISKLSGLATMRVAGGESTSHNMDASGGSVSSSVTYREVPVVRGEDLEELGADAVFFVVNHERTFKGFAAGITPWRLFSNADALMRSRDLPERIAKPGRLLEAFEVGAALERQAARIKAGGRGGLAVLPALVDLEDVEGARAVETEGTDPEMLESRGSGGGAVAWDDLGGFE